MGKIKNNQRGFSAIELILVFVIVGIIGGVGWYVLKAKNNTNNSYNNAASSSAVTKPAIIKMTTPSSVANKNVIKISALGIEVTVPDSIKDLTVSKTYTGYLNSKTVTSVNISTSTVTGKVPECSAGDPNSTSGFGVIYETDGQYPTNGVAGTTWHKQFNAFYVDFSPREGPCYPDSTSATNKALVDSQQSTFVEALPSITLIP